MISTMSTSQIIRFNWGAWKGCRQVMIFLPLQGRVRLGKEKVLYGKKN
jgi:hypothetical protein